MTALPVAGSTPEPTVESALQWWPPQRNVWTPVGWKDHLFRFNVVYNGIVIAEPCPSLMKRQHAEPYRGQDFQLTLAAYDGGAIPPLPAVPTPLYKLDGGIGRQGWVREHDTPVLWTDWPLQDGLTVRQEVFAHVPGAPDLETGIEPIYAWVRISVAHVDEVRAPERATVGLALSKVWAKDWVPYRLDDGVTLRCEPDGRAIPGGLAATPLDGGGVQLAEPAGARLAATPGPGATIEVDDGGDGTYALRIELPVEVGAYVDVLLAMVPQQPADFEPELRLGRAAALAECEEYWSRTPAGAAQIRTPEPYVDEFIRRSLQFAEVVAERNPETGERSFLTGSYGYDCLWATPTSMLSHMFLDLLGYHDTVRRHVEIFHANQGSVVPPGKAYDKHPGYFSTPSTLTSFDWFADHGAILYTLANHALVTADPTFIEHWLESIVAGCAFLRDSCALTGHDGITGLLPPAVATDEMIEVTSVWNLGWSYKGLTAAVALLQRLGDPRATEYARFAEEFRSTLVTAYRDRVASVPRWTDPYGERHPVPQANLSNGPRHAFSDLTLLDTGAMFLVWAGLMDAEDPLMRSAVEFFRVGPNRAFVNQRPNPIDRPVLVHEQSSGEPCYSWNVAHTWQLGDRSRFLEGLYGLLTGGISEQTYIASEHRNGMYGNLCTTGLIFWMLRSAVLDDQVEPGHLHLLRLCPLAWLDAGQETVFERLPTQYGTATVRFRPSPDGSELTVTTSLQSHPGVAAPTMVVHVPPDPRLRRLVVDGDRYAVSAGMRVTR